MKKTHISLALILLSGVATATAPTMVIERVTETQNGKTTTEAFQAATEVKPGDLLQRSVKLNITRPSQKATMTIPIPDQVNFVGGSARVLLAGKEKAAEITYALNEKGPYSAAPMKTVTVQENGKSVTKEIKANPNEYRAIRFHLGKVSSGQQFVLVHRVTVK